MKYIQQLDYTHVKQYIKQVQVFDRHLFSFVPLSPSFILYDVAKY